MEDRSENSTLKESKSGNCADKAKGETVDTLDSAESFNSADSNIRKTQDTAQKNTADCSGIPINPCSGCCCQTTRPDNSSSCSQT